jgi:phosphoribosylpyrophosphate synthetase
LTEETLLGRTNPINNTDIAVFTLNTSRDFGEQICAHLHLALSADEERDFEDGEHKIRPLVNVRDKDVFVIQSLHGDAFQTVNDKLCRMLFFRDLCASFRRRVTLSRTAVRRGALHASRLDLKERSALR